ncbi:MAG: TAXI family TRAP transporter solute-binding subunit [Alphaproteobacteria bacterium]|nr:TAXI family TRAP transporter solute-binding subunit [Alphaproteobacteria bacterium]
MNYRLLAAGFLAAGLFAVPAAQAQQRVTLKSAASGSSYYVMTVQLSEILRTATNGRIAATVEESQGSVQNVREAPRRPAGFIYTAPPSMVRDAQGAKAPFTDGADYNTIRTLFVMPPVTMHWIVRADAGVNDLKDLAGKRFIAGGRGTFTERQASAVFKQLGIAEQVRFSEVELNAASNAMRNRQVDGFASGSSHPTSNVQELAATMPIKLLSMTPEQVNMVTVQDPSAGPVTIAAGTYNGQTQPVHTVGIPVGAYTTAATSDDIAYEITKIFWERRADMGKVNPWWNAVARDQIAGIGVKLHPGALKYYTEAGVTIPAGMR